MITKETKKSHVLHYGKVDPDNIKPIFSTIGALYKRLIEFRRGMIRFKVTQDRKGIELRLRIPTSDLSRVTIVMIENCIQKLIVKDKYLQLKRDEEF